MEQWEYRFVTISHGWFTDGYGNRLPANKRIKGAGGTPGDDVLLDAGNEGWEMVSQLGNEGWEMISAIPLTHIPSQRIGANSDQGGTMAIQYVFKRPKS